MFTPTSRLSVHTLLKRQDQALWLTPTPNILSDLQEWQLPTAAHSKASKPLFKNQAPVNRQG